MTDEHRELIRTHSFTAGLSPEYVDRLLSMGLVAKFRPEQIIFREGDVSSFFYIIIEGTIALEVTTPGRTIRILTLGAGDELGWSSFLSTVGKQFQARSLDDVVAIAFDSARVLQASDEDPAFGYAMMRRILPMVSERLQATRFQLVDMYSPKSAREDR